MAISDCVSWKPLLNGSAQGSRNEVTRAMRYGTSITSSAMRRRAGGRGDQHVAQPRAGDEQHAEPGDEQHRRGAEVRLGEQQQRDEHQQAERLDEPHRRVAQLFLAPHRVARDEDERQHARQLGGLEVEARAGGSSGGCR